MHKIVLDFVSVCLQTDEAEKWLDDLVEKQEGTAPHEPPVLLSSDIIAKIMAIDKPFKRLSNKRAPKPPPQEPSTNSTEETKTTEGDDEEVIDSEDLEKNETVGSEEMNTDELQSHDEL